MHDVKLQVAFYAASTRVQLERVGLKRLSTFERPLTETHSGWVEHFARKWTTLK